MRRKTIIIILSVVAFSVSVAVVWPRIQFYSLTGRFSPIRKIESLNHTVSVKGWNMDGLLLEDGRTAKLPGLCNLPKDSEALVEATKRGVEIAPDGRVFGLIKIHHWCGNDPVREHITRVDISDVMIFLHIGETIGPVQDSEFTVHEGNGQFSRYGWNVSEFLQFTGWESIENSDAALKN